jgi:hypothetical protein
MSLVVIAELLRIITAAVAALLLPPEVAAAAPVWLLLVAVWFPVAFAAVALVPVMFCCCAMAVSLPMMDENPDRSAAAANIPIIGIAGDMLLTVEKWPLGFRHNVKSFECHFALCCSFLLHDDISIVNTIIYVCCSK